MTEQNLKMTDPQQQNARDSLSSTDNLTSRSGLLLVLQVFKSLRLKQLRISYFGDRVNRGYRNGDILGSDAKRRCDPAECRVCIERGRSVWISIPYHRWLPSMAKPVCV